MNIISHLSSQLKSLLPKLNKPPILATLWVRGFIPNPYQIPKIILNLCLPEQITKSSIWCRFQQFFKSNKISQVSCVKQFKAGS